MSIGHGFSDPLWAARKIVAMSHPILLKKAVIEVIDHLDQVHSSGTSPFEIIDRIVQVASEGKYTPPEPESQTVASFTLNPDGTLPEDAEQEIRDFISRLDGIPTAEKDENAESYKDFLKRLGIPDVEDFPKEEEDEQE